MGGKDLRNLLSQNIKKFRNHRSWSQAELAEQADISIPFISAIELGNKWPHPETLSKIAGALEIDVYELFKPENIMTLEVTTIISQMTRDITNLVNRALELINKQPR